jgi:glycosyltransferase involved in cell wall biosynthesis
MPPHRVHIVIARLNIGGPAIHVSLLASRLPASYAATVLTGHVGPHEGDMTYYARERGVEPVVIDGLGRELKPITDIGLVMRLYRMFRRERPSIVHTHTAKAGAVGRLAAWLARVPVIVHTFHGHVLRGYFGPTKERVFLGIERNLARITDAIITLGDHQRAEILNFGIGHAEKVVAIPLGMDLDAFLALPRRPGHLHDRLGLSKDAQLIGIVARLVPIKGHDTFLNAARRLAESLPKAHFLIVGDGELRAALAARVQELNLTARVHFLGWEKNLLGLYPDLDCLVLSSHNEGLPTAILEAHASAVPVVSTAVGSVPDLISDGNTGHLIAVGDDRALADKISQILNFPDAAARMARQAREDVSHRYGAQRLITDTDLLYRKLLAR